LSVNKRLWPEKFLPDALDLERGKPVFQPVDEIAQIDAAIDAQSEEAERYYAVLAMDGDDMGQWVSGCKAAPLVSSLAPEAQAYFGGHWPEAAPGLPPANKVPRPLSPGYHAALSEALANFSLYCARPIVEAFRGQLIYAGGDDVLAMTPASTALDCAQALQLAFRGIHPDSPEAHAATEVKEVLKRIFDYAGDPDKHPTGFVTLRKAEGAGVGRAEHLKPNWPLMLMGPKATASVGIAIGHVRSPMQDTIQAARDAETAAKKVPTKGAFALKVLKRSGEAVGFSARWQDAVVAVWGELNAGIHDLSGRFAYRYASLVKALVVTGGGAEGSAYAEAWDPTLAEAVQAELRHVLQQQGDMKADKARDLATRWCGILTAALSPRDYLHFWLTWAFVHRLGNPETHPQP
jgi:CRISPR-associated protein Cmr2